MRIILPVAVSWPEPITMVSVTHRQVKVDNCNDLSWVNQGLITTCKPQFLVIFDDRFIFLKGLLVSHTENCRVFTMSLGMTRGNVELVWSSLSRAVESHVSEQKAWNRADSFWTILGLTLECRCVCRVTAHSRDYSKYVELGPSATWDNRLAVLLNNATSLVRVYIHYFWTRNVDGTKHTTAQ